jgi:hypothetical protein
MDRKHFVGIVVIFSVLAVGSCRSELVTNNSNAPILQNTSDSMTVTESKREPLETYDIANSKGLISLKGSLLRIYNQDGSLWFEASIANEEAARASLDATEDFRPFRYDTDDWSIHLNYVGHDERYYHVIVNDETGLKKFIKKDDPNFQVGTWEQYILDCFAVQFDPESNPLLDQPNGNAQGSIPKQWRRDPEEIRGEWLRIGWHENDDDKQPRHHGWIKWKDNNKIIVGLFEIA